MSDGLDVARSVSWVDTGETGARSQEFCYQRDDQ